MYSAGARYERDDADMFVQEELREVAFSLLRFRALSSVYDWNGSVFIVRDSSKVLGEPIMDVAVVGVVEKLTKAVIT